MYYSTSLQMVSVHSLALHDASSVNNQTGNGTMQLVTSPADSSPTMFQVCSGLLTTTRLTHLAYTTDPTLPLYFPHSHKNSCLKLGDVMPVSA